MAWAEALGPDQEGPGQVREPSAIRYRRQPWRLEWAEARLALGQEAVVLPVEGAWAMESVLLQRPRLQYWTMQGEQLRT